MLWEEEHLKRKYTTSFHQPSIRQPLIGQSSIRQPVSLSTVNSSTQSIRQPVNKNRHSANSQINKSYLHKRKLTYATSFAHY